MSVMNEVEILIESFVTALERQDAQACAEFYTHDAWIFDSENAHAHKREAIEDFFRNTFTLEDPRISNIKFSVDNDLAYSVAAYSQDFRDTHGIVTQTAVGQCMHIYKRQSDGALKIHISVFIDDFQ